ncbi:WD40 repeat domain-containing protein (plasmid) [Streptomyces sp. BB1-1-1]|uniref:WD40 repeat domain-containing protein n=1 Tax=Streptomyces sp. BB1-1-1 TaxID=3074430 RepID=UPI002877F67D|nr:WD40 repeat domain-containing protein [Streptomyces sp. BB1-1-1]WND32890.1 WD40 repeat domain-containing protein [Streptomyces sp. BB1-1-1]WND40041.1 WD40 repeat domain-containing protein [Streptomyces sp. BB1-1-1]WND40876.1 WD40 repeat domain-containing protein [Streptomyces sp. BB1-1-1]
MIRHRGPISGIAAYDSTYVATAGYDNQVVLWNAADRQPLARGVHDHLANQVSFSPDGKYLLTSSSDYTARLWLLPDLKLLTVFSKHDDDVEMSVFHPTEPLIATASRDHRVRVYAFDGELRAVFEGHTADVISVEWAGAGDELISSSDDGTIKRWSLSTGAKVADVDLGGVETDTVALASNGIVYAGNDDGEIVLVRDEGTTMHPAHEAGIKRLVYNSARDLLVSLSYDRTLRVWDTSDGLAPVASSSLPSDVWPRSCAFLDGNTLVFATFGTSYATYRIDDASWDLDGVDDTPGVNAVIARRGARLTIGDAGTLREDGTERARTGSLCNFLTEVGGRVVTGGQMGAIFDAFSGKVLHQHRSPLNCGAAWVRDGLPHVVIGTYTGEGLVFSLQPDGEFRLETTLNLHGNAVKGIAVSGDSIFSVSADAEAAWFSISSLTETGRAPEAHDKIANGCVGLGDGAFASVSRDLKLRIWTGRDAVTLDTPHDHSIKCVSASADGRYIATGSYNGLVAVHDRADGTWPTVTRPTTAGISSLHYDGEARTFLAGSYDSNVYEIPLGQG